MNQSENKTQASPGLTESGLPAVRSSTRRKLLRGGALGVPALLALKSTPVMACDCALPSGFSVSGAVSRKMTACADAGPTPSSLAGNPSQYAKTTIFNTVFKTDNSSAATKSLATVLGLGNSEVHALFTAVYLQSMSMNSGNGTSGFPSTAYVKNMWSAGYLGSGYVPPDAPGVTWTQKTVVDYMLYLTGQGGFTS